MSFLVYCPPFLLLLVSTTQMDAACSVSGWMDFCHILPGQLEKKITAPAGRNKKKKKEVPLSSILQGEKYWLCVDSPDRAPINKTNAVQKTNNRAPFSKPSSTRWRVMDWLTHILPARVHVIKSIPRHPAQGNISLYNAEWTNWIIIKKIKK